jgi:Nucleotide modification associated domain 3
MARSSSSAFLTKKGVSEHKYGTCLGRNGVPHSDYFAPKKRRLMAEKHVHLDPEFETFTYGDPTTPKGSLKTLERGDLLVFYCGLQEWDSEAGWNREVRPGLYIIGYFEVAMAGLATEFSQKTLRSEFGKNFHVRYPSVFKAQKDRLVLVKGGPRSRLLKKAYRISVEGKDKAGKPLKVLSPAMQESFGNFGGHVSIQRSPPRWVAPEFVDRAIGFLNSLK